jgi:DNA adenine methylase
MAMIHEEVYELENQGLVDEDNLCAITSASEMRTDTAVSPPPPRGGSLKNVRSFIRYPGGKAKLQCIIRERLAKSGMGKAEYREPFFGGGGVGLRFLFNQQCPQINTAWINDKDKGMACLWTAVIRHPEMLTERVREFIPTQYFDPEDDYESTLEPFDYIRDRVQMAHACTMPKDPGGIVEVGFWKLVIHQCSYSGLGTRSGGPLGGANQESRYKIDSRWSPAHICKRIRALHEAFKTLRLREEGCTCLDFDELIKTPGDCILYLDPPYYQMGGTLYQCSFQERDHVRLRDALRDTRHAWVLSYDKHEYVRALYADFAEFQEIDVNYSITATKTRGADGRREYRTKPEFLIYPKRYFRA